MVVEYKYEGITISLMTEKTASQKRFQFGINIIIISSTVKTFLSSTVIAAHSFHTKKNFLLCSILLHDRHFKA